MNEHDVLRREQITSRGKGAAADKQPTDPRRQAPKDRGCIIKALQWFFDDQNRIWLLFVILLGSISLLVVLAKQALDSIFPARDLPPRTISNIERVFMDHPSRYTFLVHPDQSAELQVITVYSGDRPTRLFDDVPADEKMWALVEARVSLGDTTYTRFDIHVHSSTSVNGARTSCVQ